MKHFLISIAAILITPLALATAPSDDSIRQLMEVSDTRKLLEGSLAQADQIMQASMQQALSGEEISAEDQEVIDEMRQQMLTLMKAELSWQVLEPMFIEVYQKSLNQAEVDGMLEFYKSDAGKAVVAKMPQIMQHTMVLMQQRMASMGPKIQEIQLAAMNKLKENKQQ
ncbi:DUF2059 domain-containing protein [Microbulbifer aggregans]|uniref:DUF2059 domain-containing protein n=1 Tax=Microbulbifer aggregans TaxID=1769779 RepID=UPI001CFC6277|nr:DUF2059 domain-containing protein [Microbulbifer aggregans]